MSEITIWSTVHDDGAAKHNHIEDGYIEGDFPKPFKKEYTNQKSWEKMKWKKEFGYLIDGKVVRN